MSHQFKMSNKHVFYKLIRTHQYCFIVTSHQIIRV